MSRSEPEKSRCERKKSLAIEAEIMYTQLTWWGIVGVVPPFVGNQPTEPPESDPQDRGGDRRGQDHCLAVFSDESWNAKLEQLRPKSYSEVKSLRTVFAYAADCEPDAQGRILIPAKLRQYAGLEKEVIINGSFDRVEIWNAGRWAEMEEKDFSSGSLEAAMESMGL